MSLTNNQNLSNLKYNKYQKSFSSLKIKGRRFIYGNILYPQWGVLNILLMKSFLFRQFHLNLLYLLIRKNLRHKVADSGKKSAISLQLQTFIWAVVTKKPAQVRRGSGKGYVDSTVSPSSIQRQLFYLRGSFFSPRIFSSHLIFRKWGGKFIYNYLYPNFISKIYLNYFNLYKLKMRKLLYNKRKKKFRITRLFREYENRKNNDIVNYNYLSYFKNFLKLSNNFINSKRILSIQEFNFILKKNLKHNIFFVCEFIIYDNLILIKLSKKNIFYCLKKK